MLWHEPRGLLSSWTGLPPGTSSDSLLRGFALAWGWAPGQPDRHSLLLLTCTGMSLATELLTGHPAQQAYRTPVSWPRPASGAWQASFGAADP